MRACLPRWTAVAILGLGVVAPATARADEPAAGGDAIGVTIDLLPIVLSAAHGEAGGSLQLWYGHRHVRGRLVAAHIAFPDAFASDGFRDKTTDVGAAIVDYLFGDRFDGWWIGAGGEYWANRMINASNGEAGRWSNLVATAGGGYIWRVYRTFYVEPWGAAHLLVSGTHTTIGGADHDDQRVTAEVSLKLGVFFDL
jgi:hypothetical protein